MKRRKPTAFLLALAVFIAALWIPIPAQAASMKISHKTLNLTVGETKTLKVTTSLKGKISWKSSDRKIATVTSKGKVTAKKTGTAKITAKLKGKSVSCKVTVKKKDMKAQAKDNAKKYKRQIEQVLKYTNQYRKKAGQKNLVLDTNLTRAACYRSLEMAKTKKMSHTRPDGSSCFTILKVYKVSYMAAGENIAYTSKGYGVNAKVVSQMWYNSPGHRANMLSGSYGKIGIGVAVASNGDIYYTQLFTN
ncbi:MAG: Ig-like domain-containing protein [Lachnospiraceae bacterium]|nr:Ig-like domain-containing protein [Lachnospiraceae bacterium]